MAEEVTIFVRPNENYTYKTPFQTINIIQMSEDEQDDPDPIKPGTDPEPLLIAYSTNGTDFINLKEITWKTNPNPEVNIHGLLITNNSFILTTSSSTLSHNISNIIYYYQLPTTNKYYFKTKYNKIIEIDDAGLYKWSFQLFNLKSIIPCTNEMAETFNSFNNFDKLNAINDMQELINYTTWGTTNEFNEYSPPNVCYIPETDELYIGKKSYIPETTGAYFYNNNDVVQEDTIWAFQNSIDYAAMQFRGRLLKITEASTIFNMTHE